MLRDLLGLGPPLFVACDGPHGREIIITCERGARLALATDVTHALTLKGARITWAIINGFKGVENRHLRIKPGWVALHTGVGKLDPKLQPLLESRCPGIPAEDTLPHGAIVGAMHVRERYGEWRWE